MKFTWQQPYQPNNRWNRLWHAQLIIQSHNTLIKFDQLEPITDTTQAEEYLQRFTLKNNDNS